jgi:hypothetical protein
MLFGLIHCVGWSLVFPSDTERLIWRVSAVIISALPVLILVSILHLPSFIRKLREMKMPSEHQEALGKDSISCDFRSFATPLSLGYLAGYLLY